MSEYLLEANVMFYKYTCETCSEPIYRDNQCLDNCPHCGGACGEITDASSEDVQDTIYYEIDPKNGKLAIYE